MTFNALTSAVTVAGVARDAGVVGIDSRDLQRSEPEDLALLAVIRFLEDGAGHDAADVVGAGLTRVDRQYHLISADLGLDALDGIGHLITDNVTVGLDSLGRLPGGLATRLQR
jgi:hypothetical protein